MNRQHDLLLRAALGRGAEAIEAWRAWSDATSVDSLDQDAQWLLPLLSDNLAQHGIAHDELTRYANVYRHHWYRNLLALRRFEPSLEAPGFAGVVYGGAAIALERIDAIGVRPFETVRQLNARHGLFGPPFDDELIGRSRSIEWRGRQWPVLDPADHLVVICVSRGTWSRRSSLLWIADVAIVLDRHPTVDRERVESLAHRLGSGADVARALDEVADRCGLDTSLSRAPT